MLLPGIFFKLSPNLYKNWLILYLEELEAENHRILHLRFENVQLETQFLLQELERMQILI